MNFYVNELQLHERILEAVGLRVSWVNAEQELCNRVDECTVELNARAMQRRQQIARQNRQIKETNGVKTVRRWGCERQTTTLAERNAPLGLRVALLGLSYLKMIVGTDGRRESF